MLPLEVKVQRFRPGVLANVSGRCLSKGVWSLKKSERKHNSTSIASLNSRCCCNSPERCTSPRGVLHMIQDFVEVGVCKCGFRFGQARTLNLEAGFESGNRKVTDRSFWDRWSIRGLTRSHTTSAGERRRFALLVEMSELRGSRGADVSIKRESPISSSLKPVE